MTTIEELRKQRTHLNPYSQKKEIRELLKLERELQKQQDKNVNDALNDINIPESLREQN